MAANYVSQWDFKDKHLDDGIDSNSFQSAARCIIYAALNGNSGEGTDFHRIGVVQGYNWGEQRSVELIYEVGSDIPYLIPGRTIGSISLSRILIFGADLLNVMYYGSDAVKEMAAKGTEGWLRSLKDINKPLDLMIASYGNGGSTYTRVFTECYIESRSESINSGQILIAEQCSIRYSNCAKASISTSN